MMSDDDVARGHQLAHDLSALVTAWTQRDAAFVAVHLHEEAAFAPLGDRDHPTIFAAAALLHSDDVGAHVTQQTRTVGARDVAAEVENSDAFQNLIHE